MRRTVRAGILPGCFLALAACAEQDAGRLLVEDLRGQISGGAPMVRLKLPDGVPWDRAEVVTPYTPLDRLPALLFANPDVRRSGIDMRDSVNLVVFVRGDGIVRVVELPRGVLDLSGLPDRTIAPGQCLRLDPADRRRAVGAAPC